MNEYALADELYPPPSRVRVTLGSIGVKGFREEESLQIASIAAPLEEVNHPIHYGGDNPLEVINIIEHYELGFHLGNVVKYILRAGKKDGDAGKDLRKASWYLDRKIAELEATNA